MSNKDVNKNKLFMTAGELTMLLQTLYSVGDGDILSQFSSPSFWRLNLGACGALLKATVKHKLLPMHATDSFLARDTIYAIERYMPLPLRPSVRPSVCLFVTRVDQSKTVAVMIMITTE